MLPWIRPGVFLKWRHKGVRPNPVDCCINVNVIALITAARLADLPVYREACACTTIQEGIRWANRSHWHAGAILPTPGSYLMLFGMRSNGALKTCSSLFVCGRSCRRDAIPMRRHRSLFPLTAPPGRLRYWLRREKPKLDTHFESRADIECLRNKNENYAYFELGGFEGHT